MVPMHLWKNIFQINMRKMNFRKYSFHFIWYKTFRKQAKYHQCDTGRLTPLQMFGLNFVTMSSRTLKCYCKTTPTLHGNWWHSQWFDLKKDYISHSK